MNKFVDLKKYGDILVGWVECIWELGAWIFWQLFEDIVEVVWLFGLEFFKFDDD